MNSINYSFNEMLRNKASGINQFLSTYRNSNVIEFTSKDPIPRNNLGHTFSGADLIVILASNHRKYCDSNKERITSGNQQMDDAAAYVPYIERLHLNSPLSLKSTRLTSKQREKIEALTPIEL